MQHSLVLAICMDNLPPVTERKQIESAFCDMYEKEGFLVMAHAGDGVLREGVLRGSVARGGHRVYVEFEDGAGRWVPTISLYALRRDLVGSNINDGEVECELDMKISPDHVMRFILKKLFHEMKDRGVAYQSMMDSAQLQDFDDYVRIPKKCLKN